MKFKNPLLVVTDMEKSKRFYKEVLGLRVIMDFGANVTLTGGLCLQTKESWQEFIHAKEEDITFGGNNAEIYFEPLPGKSPAISAKIPGSASA